ncbi:penicillin-binding proteins 1A/1B [Fictibacillus macauensis ZFHKF-1]|uniref:Penicillin-binding proteins 1A/1B n=1 Tax=Fictibacillus macauensis ZFHKF-1 TaxID=1196324 RepID=I8UI51_9BACL|nr:PBP1A family penicillin-binding protein [Fictibacillus macauensis]EIT86493.1 penicillin-binding proteins 1A/1B [Fictibacillus macauensis ZFHKF-1]
MENNTSSSRMDRRKQTGKKPPSKKEKVKPTGFRKFLKYGFRTFLVLLLLVLGGGGAYAYKVIHGTPDLDPNKLKYSSSSTVYDMNDKKVASIVRGEKRDYAKIDSIPPLVRKAFVDTEDVRFYKHNGIDAKRVLGAVLSNLTRGYGSEGASTITQQVVKNSFLTMEKTATRKLQEAYLAMQLERQYSKDQILEFYLNRIYFGNGAYGVKTAAKLYFDKKLDELTPGEAALLAGLPQRPNGYDPYKYPKNAKDRRNTVLYLMNKYGAITKDQEEKAKKQSIEKMVVKKKQEKPQYEAFLQQVVKDAEKQGISEKDVFEGGLKIYTTLDPDAQTHAEKVLETNDYVQYPDKKFQAGVVLLDTKTGQIRAIGGSRNDANTAVATGFNYATDTARQPGSTIKPVLDYGPAIEHLKWSTATGIKDEPLQINGKQFQNWDHQFHGTLSMRKALEQSYNIPAIKAFQAVGADRAKQFANNLGLGLKEIMPAYAIGGFKTGVSPLQMAGAYSAFGNNGVYHTPTTVRKVVYPNGEEKTYEQKGKQAMSEYTAYMVTDMLRSVVKTGTGTAAQIPGLDVAGKTGTTNMPAGVAGDGSTDAWFAGYTTRYTAAVWTGYDRPGANAYVRHQDQNISKMIFKSLVGYASQNKDTEDFQKPSSVVERGGELYVEGTSMPAAPPEVSDDDQKKDPADDADKEKEDQDQKDDEDKKDDDNKDKPKDGDQPPEGPTTPPDQKPGDGGNDKPGDGDNKPKPPKDDGKPKPPGDGGTNPGDGGTKPTDPGKPPKKGNNPNGGDDQSPAKQPQQVPKREEE